MLAINEDRVLGDLRALAEFGKAGTGVNRPAFSDADIEARRWLMAQMQSAGLETVIDGIGNVYGGVLGAFLLAAIENIGVWQVSSEWKSTIAFSVLILFLLFRPRGIFRR